MASMNISLSDQMKDYVEQQIRSGQYHNASEYIRDLIRQDQKRREERLRQEAWEAAVFTGERPTHIPPELFEEALATVRRRIDAAKSSAARKDVLNDDELRERVMERLLPYMRHEESA